MPYGTQEYGATYQCIHLAAAPVLSFKRQLLYGSWRSSPFLLRSITLNARAKHMVCVKSIVKEVCSEAETGERNLRSKLWWFTEFCISHYVSHFTAFFIVTRTKISIAKSCAYSFTVAVTSDAHEGAFTRRYVLWYYMLNQRSLPKRAAVTGRTWMRGLALTISLLDYWAVVPVWTHAIV